MSFSFSLKDKARALTALCATYKAHHGQLLIVISGLSGAGKSYWADRLARLLRLEYIEQDHFYISPHKMPMVTCSNGHQMRNWDCLEALDFQKQNATIDKHLSKGIILSGFACRANTFRHRVDVHIHLRISPKTCQERRLEQGKDDPKFSKIIVDEFVYPFYLETFKSSTIDAIIDADRKSTFIGHLLIHHMMNTLVNINKIKDKPSQKHQMELI